ncbi:hypothetical protein [Ruficoccus sp. ZRK36]|uniref:hypothetical protein n=1 Tax=Ruficoccus sp. ZRK36 TaxID=2866311 RepID=UPI001C734C36|nr:hypothetical protein [Ruficoccus sp. ZRK36]QYY34344.1 hypothetical protein K0V07_08430 [Ruficoccus sp. ZRK36]
MSLFTRLFNKSRRESDGLKQEQREAIVDLLGADGKADSEKEFLTRMRTVLHLD